MKCCLFFLLSNIVSPVSQEVWAQFPVPMATLTTNDHEIFLFLVYCHIKMVGLGLSTISSLQGWANVGLQSWICETQTSFLLYYFLAIVSCSIQTTVNLLCQTLYSYYMHDCWINRITNKYLEFCIMSIGTWEGKNISSNQTNRASWLSEGSIERSFRRALFYDSQHFINIKERY